MLFKLFFLFSNEFSYDAFGRLLFNNLFFFDIFIVSSSEKFYSSSFS